MQVFNYDDYKSYLVAMIDESEVRGYQSLLAKAAGCQRAYISQVLRTKNDLTMDHAIGLCHFWNLNELETDYFMELVTLARAGTQILKSHSRHRLQKLFKIHSDLSNQFKKSKDLNSLMQEKYYSSWHWGAVHMITSIKGFQTVSAISKRLGMTESLTEKVIQGLVEMGLLTKIKTGLWENSTKEVFLKRENPMNFSNHWNWRSKALEDIQKGNLNSIHYTAIHTLSVKDFEKFKLSLIEFISHTRKLVGPSPEEELISFSCDLFRVEGS